MGIGQAAEFDWSGHGRLALDTPAGWKLDRTDLESPGCALQGRPDSGSNALLQITVV